MGDEQTPHSDLIDDAIRQAEKQLEAKLEALRMSALGEVAPGTSDHDDVAILRPTAAAPTHEEPAPAETSMRWQEADSDDLIFRPSGDAVIEHSFTSTVSDLVPNWDDEDEISEPAPAPARAVRDEVRSDVPPQPPAPTPAPVAAAPQLTEDELEFWAQTRTALRNLQAVTYDIPGRVSDTIGSELQRVLHDEITETTSTLRIVQQQLQLGLPKVTERLDASLEEQLAEPNSALRQLREELPGQLDRVARETRSAVREDLDRSAASIHSAVQHDVAQLEQSVATNVTRMTDGVSASVDRVERDIDTLGETVVRFERGVHSEFDRVEAQLRTAIEQVSQNVLDELVEPTETVKKLDDELPARFTRIEHKLLEQMQSSQREVSIVLSGLVEASRASMDRIGALASTVDEERARRTDDVDVIVDTVTTGWEGLAGAIKALYEQGEENNRRIGAIEERLEELHDLEGAVDSTMQQLRDVVGELTPAPVVVTVSHPEAEVRNSSRSGWLPDSSGN